MKDARVKDVAQVVAQDVAKDVAEGVLGAAEDGSAKVFAARVIFHRRNPRPTQACRPYAALGRHVKDEHVKDAAQDVAQGGAEDITQDVAQDFALGASGPGARPPRHHRRRRLCAAYDSLR